MRAGVSIQYDFNCVKCGLFKFKGWGFPGLGTYFLENLGGKSVRVENLRVITKLELKEGKFKIHLKFRKDGREVWDVKVSRDLFILLFTIHSVVSRPLLQPIPVTLTF